MASTLIVLKERVLRKEHRRRTILSDMMWREVIPALRKRHDGKPVAEPRLSDADVVKLAGLSLGDHGDAVIDFVTALHRQGISAESLYLELLSPAAALLGCYWSDDTCSFADVTVGLGQLHAALRALSPAFLREPADDAAVHAPARARARTPVPHGATQPRAMLVPVPGEQHTFGLAMLSDFFERDGWATWSGPVADDAELKRLVKREPVDLVGISVGCDDLLERAARAVAVVRQSSANPGVVVLVGGPCFVKDPQLAEQIGADGTASDGRQAAIRAAELLRTRKAG